METNLDDYLVYASSCVNHSSVQSLSTNLKVLYKTAPKYLFPILVTYSSENCSSASANAPEILGATASSYTTKNNTTLFSLFDFESTGAPACLDGQQINDRCWFLGEEGESCTTVCSNRGLAYNSATQYLVGTYNYTPQTSACETMLANFGFSGTPTENYDYPGGSGCYVNSGASYINYYDTTADNSNGEYARVCSCGEDPDGTLPFGLTYKLTTAPTNIQAGNCEGPFVIELQDNTDNAYTLSESISAVFGSNNADLFSDAGCGTALTDITLDSSSSSKTFYVNSTIAGNLTFALTAPTAQPTWNYSNGGLSTSVDPGVAVRVGFYSESTSYYGTNTIESRHYFCPGNYISVYDVYGNRVPAPGNVVSTIAIIGDSGDVDSLVTTSGSCSNANEDSAVQTLTTGNTQSSYVFYAHMRGPNAECGYSDITVSAPGYTPTTYRYYLDNSPKGNCI